MFILNDLQKCFLIFFNQKKKIAYAQQNDTYAITKRGKARSSAYTSTNENKKKKMKSIWQRFGWNIKMVTYGEKLTNQFNECFI